MSACGDSDAKLQVTTASSSLTLYPDNISKGAIVVSAALPGNPYQPISVTLQGLPAGVSASPATLSILNNGQAAFVLKAATTSVASQATVPIMVQATGGSHQGSTTVSLTIASQNPDFTPATMDLPVLDLTTENAAPIVSETDYVTGSMSITPPASSTYPVFSGTMQIKGHGNTTWSLPKKPYKVKLDTKAGLLGMPSGKDWVLLANYDDKSLLRDQVAFEAGRRVGMAWTPNSQFVEVFLNGQYQGNYQLTEEIKIDKHRVNIPEMDDTDISRQIPDRRLSAGS